jgi:predicted RNase H-like nuclease (RuvC/YqgF family)
VSTYAQIYLRHEALRTQVRRLNDALAELHAELDRRGLEVEGLKSRLDKVERTASEIDRQTL